MVCSSIPPLAAETISEAGLVPTVDFLFQAAFAGTAATIVSGLVAERIKFGEFVIFALVLTAFIYPVAGSWEWNGGWLNSVGNKEFIDFAGSSIVHSVGAWAGLVGAMLLGPRIGKYVGGKAQAIPGHNMSIATLGLPDPLDWLVWLQPRIPTGDGPMGALRRRHHHPWRCWWCHWRHGALHDHLQKA